MLSFLIFLLILQRVAQGSNPNCDAPVESFYGFNETNNIKPKNNY